MKLPGPLTDSSAGTASAVAMGAVADGSTYANDIAAIRNNFSTSAVTFNALIALVRNLQKRVEALEGR